jgi:transglutaminase-like putative cysteine protease
VEFLKMPDTKRIMTLNNNAKFFPLLWLAIVWISITGNPGEGLATSQTGYTIPRHIEYGFTLQNTTNSVLKEAALWVYAPVKQTAAQQSVNVDASHPFQELSDDLGNVILYFHFSDLPPYATKILTVRADLLLSETPNVTPLPSREGPGEGENLSPYLQPEPYCESDDSEIQQLAKHLIAAEPIETARNIFQWEIENITSSGYLKNPRGALYALHHQQGDCTEFMYLFVALCRAAGIPARGLGGYVYAKNAILKPADYHNWAEFYVDGVWHIADPQRKIFKQNQSHYLVMRVIGAVADDHPMGHYRRFRYVGEGLKVRMN